MTDKAYVLLVKDGGVWKGLVEQSFSMIYYPGWTRVWTGDGALNNALYHQERGMREKIPLDIYEINDPKCPVNLNIDRWKREVALGTDKFRFRNASFSAKPVDTEVGVY